MCLSFHLGDCDSIHRVPHTQEVESVCVVVSLYILFKDGTRITSECSKVLSDKAFSLSPFSGDNFFSFLFYFFFGGWYGGMDICLLLVDVSLFTVSLDWLRDLDEATTQSDVTSVFRCFGSYRFPPTKCQLQALLFLGRIGPAPFT